MRARRFKVFKDLVLGVGGKSVSILDIGGTIDFWDKHAPFLHDVDKPIDITIINIPPITTEKSHSFGNVSVHIVEGDATNMRSIDTFQFDLAFSNSVIEHVGNLYQQMAMANEVMRISKGYFIQTPNYWFPVEPHFLFPFWGATRPPRYSG